MPSYLTCPKCGKVLYHSVLKPSPKQKPKPPKGGKY